VAYGVYRGAHIKKISAAWHATAAPAGSGDAERQEDEAPAGSHIIKAHFGDELLFVCYEFYDRFKSKPKDWKELFEFLKFVKVKNIYKEMAYNAAKRGHGGG
jgi:hypothetical protein